MKAVTCPLSSQPWILYSHEIKLPFPKLFCSSASWIKAEYTAPQWSIHFAFWLHRNRFIWSVCHRSLFGLESSLEDIIFWNNFQSSKNCQLLSGISWRDEAGLVFQCIKNKKHKGWRTDLTTWAVEQRPHKCKLSKCGKGFSFICY